VGDTVAAIEVHQLTKVYTTFRKQEGLLGALRSLVHRERVYKEAVCGISFEISAGEMVGFLGPNGAGKTTVMKMLSGILRPTSGDARVFDHIPWRREKAFLQRLSLVMGQKAQLNWDLPAADSFLLNRDIYEIEPKLYRQRLTDLVDLFEIQEVLHVPVRQLSLGERMKCELVGSLLHAPDLLLLDEPTIGLDVVSQKKLRTFLRAYQEEHGTTVLLTSHYMQDIQELCQRVIVVDHGAAIFDGLLSQLVHQAKPLRRLRLVFATAHERDLPELRSKLSQYGCVLELTKWGVTLEVENGSATQALASLLHALPIDDVTIEETGAEDVLADLFDRRDAVQEVTP
jgi:ABC-2 type transport system ATP-binding protein